MQTRRDHECGEINDEMCIRVSKGLDHKLKRTNVKTMGRLFAMVWWRLTKGGLLEQFVRNTCRVVEGLPSTWRPLPAVDKEGVSKFLGETPCMKKTQG